MADGAWAAAVGLALVLAVSAPLAGAFWGASLLAHFSAQAAVCTAAAGVAAVVRKRPRLALVLAACLAVHGLQFVRPRAARSDGPPTVRLLVHNAHAENPAIEAVLGNIRRSGADVVVLVEPNPEIVRALHRDAPFADLYPYVLMRGPRPDLTPWRIVLSRWPLEDRRTPDELRCVVRAPAGDFAVIAIHPASPRDAGRWRRGNALVRAAAASARDFAAEGLPVLVAGDLNATPSGWRERLLTGPGGVRRCKPRLALAGTFPAALPAPLRLAIDDAWVSPEWRVCSWGLGPPAGSDHASVWVHLRLGGE